MSASPSLKLRQQPTTPLELALMLVLLVAWPMGISAAWGSLNGIAEPYEYVLGVPALPATVLAAFLARRTRKLERSRKKEIIDSGSVPVRVAAIQSEWDDGNPTYRLQLFFTDSGKWVGEVGRWHTTEPPPHWTSRLRVGDCLLAFWDEDLESAAIDWEASEEYEPGGLYRDGI